MTTKRMTVLCVWSDDVARLQRKIAKTQKLADDGSYPLTQSMEFTGRVRGMKDALDILKPFSLLGGKAAR